jgi:acetyl esterase/lipase
MKRSYLVSVFLGMLALAPLPLAPLHAGEEAVSRTEDVIYGRKYGTALTMDIFTPKKANGAAVVFVMSGGWFSSHDVIDPADTQEFTRRGYTVFAVVHASQPKFTIPEMIEDMHRSVRFIRHHAKKYHIDPDRIGITGASAGGHLSLLIGTAGKKGNPSAKDPVDRASSQVQAVACFFPPTDFLNYGAKGEIALGRGLLSGYRAAFDFHEFDKKTQCLLAITDEDRILAIGRDISPIYHVSADSSPTLIIHGDADKIVPIQQSESIVSKLREAGVTAQLMVKKGFAHGWRDADKDMVILADWFDLHLKKKN